MPLAMRTSGAFWSRRSSASTATRNSAAVTVLEGASCAGPPAASCSSAPWRRRATRSGKAASTESSSASSSRPRCRGGSTMRRTCRTVCAVRGSHGASISTSRSERVACSLPRRQALAGAQQRRHGAAIFGHAAAARLHHQAREPRMQRIARHLAGQCSGRAQLREQVARVLHRGRPAGHPASRANRGRPRPWRPAAAPREPDRRARFRACRAPGGGRNPPADRGGWRGPGRCVRRGRRADWRTPG